MRIPSLPRRTPSTSWAANPAMLKAPASDMVVRLWSLSSGLFCLRMLFSCDASVQATRKGAPEGRLSKLSHWDRLANYSGVVRLPVDASNVALASALFLWVTVTFVLWPDPENAAVTSRPVL